MNLSLRIPHIAIAVGTVVVVIGALLFHDDGEAAMQLVGLIGLIVMFGTMFALFIREERQERRQGKEPQ